ncbi:MAG: ABC transporter permease [Bifidobacterium sp.]|jgi:ABC-2 type transport system permease protein|nr:ABC transporter permease [Bifidobacterium sp.]
MGTVATIVALRWSLTLATLRKSAWQTVAMVISAVLGLGVIIGVTIAAWMLGAPRFAASQLSDSWFTGIMQPVVVLLGASVTIFVIFIQLMLIGEGSSLGPQRFALYGIKDRTLQAGLLISGLTGIPAIVGAVSLLLWSLAYRWAGPIMVLTQIVAALLAVVTMMSLSKLVIALSTTLVRSKRGKSVFYIVAMLGFITVFQLPNIIFNSSDSRTFSPESFGSAASLLGWTPLGAAFQLPFDTYAGHWAALLGRIAVLVLTCVGCFMGCTWCLRRDRLTSESGLVSVKAKGVGAFAWMPDSVSGAVSARLLTNLRRDPRQALMLLMPVFFVVIFALQAHGISAVTWQALLWGGLFLNLSESNGLAYDGRGFAMQAAIGVRGIDDRRGRVRVYAVIIVGYLAILGLAIMLFTGDWRTTQGWAMAGAFLGGSFALALGGLGLAEMLSCVLIYPVASLDKPFSSPQGRALSQSLMPFATMLGTALFALPTIVCTAILVASDNWNVLWIIGPVGLVNGVLMLELGVWLGGKIMDARLLKIVATLDFFASLQK